MQGNAQNICNSIKIRLRIHKAGTDVLVYSRDCQFVFFHNFKNLRNVFLGNAEFCFLSACNNLFVVTCADSRIYSYSTCSFFRSKFQVTATLTEKFKLGKTVQACHNAVLQCKNKFFRGNVVRYKEYAFFRKARFKKHLKFTCTHCITVESFFKSNFKNVNVCVCLYGIIGGVRIFCDYLAYTVHTVAKNTLVVYIKRCAVFGSNLFGIVAFKIIGCFDI